MSNDAIADGQIRRHFSVASLPAIGGMHGLLAPLNRKAAAGSRQNDLNHIPGISGCDREFTSPRHYPEQEMDQIEESVLHLGLIAFNPIEPDGEAIFHFDFGIVMFSMCPD